MVVKVGWANPFFVKIFEFFFRFALLENKFMLISINLKPLEPGISSCLQEMALLPLFSSFQAHWKPHFEEKLRSLLHSESGENGDGGLRGVSLLMLSSCSSKQLAQAERVVDGWFVFSVWNPWMSLVEIDLTWLNTCITV